MIILELWTMKGNYWFIIMCAYLGSENSEWLWIHITLDVTDRFQQFISYSGTSRKITMDPAFLHRKILIYGISPSYNWCL